MVTRRDFLRTAGWATAAAAICPGTLLRAAINQKAHSPPEKLPPEPFQLNAKVVKHPSYSDFKTYIQAHKYVVVEIGAPSCAPCKVFEERVDNTLSKDPRAGNLSFVFINAFDNADGSKIAQEYGLEAHVPHVFLIINGKIDWKKEKIKPITPPVDGITSQEEFDAVLFKSADRFFSWIKKEQENRER
ncbi:MAG: thioredoxin family protein [Candidatus Micrarchaeia archaeon]